MRFFLGANSTRATFLSSPHPRETESLITSSTFTT